MKITWDQIQESILTIRISISLTQERGLKLLIKVNKSKLVRAILSHLIIRVPLA